MSSAGRGGDHPADVDPVLLDVVRNQLGSISEEMTTSLVKTAYSTNIKDREDASCALYAADGRVVDEAIRSAPVLTGTMKYAVSRILEDFDRGEMRAGDVFVYNTPYPVGPHHLNDISLAAPVFVDDDLFAFVGSQAHHVDVGGSEPGSMPAAATEIYQEGLQIPPVRLVDGGDLCGDVLKLIKENIRVPRITEGDLWAQIAAANTGRDRLGEFVDDHGRAEADRYVEELMDYAERHIRSGIRETIPDGVYEFEDVIEGDGITDDHVRLHVEITVDDGSVVVDFTDSADQVRGPANWRPPGVVACVKFALRAIVDPYMPTNEGTMRPITVETREGSILEPEYPAPVCSAGMFTSQRIIDVIFGALRDAVPERICAACSGTMNTFNIGGPHPESGEYFNYVETYGGGQGGMYDRDGMDGVQNHMTNTRNAPVEVLEHAYPFHVEEYALVPDSEGAGEYRGGTGLRRDIRFDSDRVKVTLVSDRRKVRPWGIDGGHRGGPSRCRLVYSDGSVEQLPTKFSMEVEDRGARIVTETPGGGGWGDPSDRDPSAVVDDVRAGLVSRDRAREVYGVAVDDDGTLDEAATRALRSGEGGTEP